MQTRRIQLQHWQLELFYPQSELIHWHKLPHDIQQETKTLLAKLLREYLGTQLPRSTVKESKYE
jgi:hypothetical protein